MYRDLSHVTMTLCDYVYTSMAQEKIASGKEASKLPGIGKAIGADERWLSD